MTGGIEHEDQIRRMVDDEAMKLFRVLDLLLDLKIAVFPLPLLQGSRDSLQQLLGGAGLGQKILGAFAHDSGGLVKARIAAKNNDAGIDILGLNKIKHLLPRDIRHIQIKQHQPQTPCT